MGFITSQEVPLDTVGLKIEDPSKEGTPLRIEFSVIVASIRHIKTGPKVYAFKGGSAGLMCAI